MLRWKMSVFNFFVETIEMITLNRGWYYKNPPVNPQALNIHAAFTTIVKF